MLHLLLSICLMTIPALAVAEEMKMPQQVSVSPPEVTYSKKLQQQLISALKAKGQNYKPRTRHLYPDGSPKYINRLILEDSPYLLQHAHNPVDWHPWGKEAFDQALRENKPVFLSIGYATCHWCHVMEEESFDNPDIAGILNKYFIPIKVDRERRPDVDATYMNAVMLVTGHGGWPLSAFLTPEGKLFYGATYFPPQQFKQLVLRIADAWQKQRAEIEAQAQEITQAVEKMNAAGQEAGEVDAELARQAIQEILSHFDPVHGGFGDAPKFPNEPWLTLLADEAWRSRDPKGMKVFTQTLDAMARGGIYDQIGGGFHRYATDAAWLVPHFEKMLYNQAQLGLLYTQAYLVTGNRFFERIARQTFDYVLREMTAPEGGFYSATDADSEGEEGKFFVWTPAQIKAVLSPGDAALAIEIYGVTERGNFEGKNILHLPQPLEAFACSKGMKEADLLDRLETIRQKLYQARAKRVPPLRDDKIVTAWNGMMIASLADAGRLLSEPRYLQAAQKAAEFLWQHHQRDGRLLRSSLESRASGDAMQEDYAWLALGFLTLYDADAGDLWLQRAQTLTRTLLTDYWDEKAGAFYMNRTSAEPLMVRPMDTYDNAVPSGNAVAARLLARLLKRSPQLLYETRFNRLRAALSGQIRRSPAGMANFLLAVREYELGETGPLQYLAQGNAKAAVKWQNAALTVEITLKPGWHINAYEAADSDLIPTTLKVASPGGWQLHDIHFPAPQMKSFGFTQKPLAVYEGKVVISASLVPGKGPLSLQLNLQACNSQHCLAPEQAMLQVPIISSP
ncbi:MAG: hypothetical protein AXA67_00950 [Methylothermaceae bacteria B42]|nr:MAG: hypothetical protein AXA67_00950 [Methylothermaceae bacteria B42]HHJ38230.1 DUF255 domain-containing protein [Methylothermaceae bacterium]